jgi:hypothetical protein
MMDDGLEQAGDQAGQRRHADDLAKDCHGTAQSMAGESTRMAYVMGGIVNGHDRREADAPDQEHAEHGSNQGLGHDGGTRVGGGSRPGSGLGLHVDLSFMVGD